MKWNWTSIRKERCPVTDGPGVQGPYGSVDRTVIKQPQPVDLLELRYLEVRLQQSQSQLRIAIDAAESALREKELLLREFKHRIKNNLQLISSLLSLQSSKIQDRDTRALFHECRTRIQAIALVHDLLHKIPSSSGFDLHSFFVELVQNLHRCYSSHVTAILPSIVVENIAIETKKITQCALIVNELVCNAFKHAFPDGRSGHIGVEVRQQDGRVILKVADDGIGMVGQASRGSGVGEQIIQALVNQLSGNIEWIVGHGTSAVVTFPANKEIGGTTDVRIPDPCR